MYVTDVPVVDRLAATAVRELDAATDALETAIADLEGWIEEADPDVGEKHPPHYYGVPPTPGEIHKGLSGALSAASAAFDHAMDALDLAGVPTL